MRDQDLVNALPSWGDADVPTYRDRYRETDKRAFSDVIRIFVRTWPYLLPQILGHWREFAIPWSFRQSSDSTEWSFRYVPLLVTVLALIGPATELVPIRVNWQLDLLVGATAAMTALIWLMIAVKGVWYVACAVALVLIGTAANLFAIFAVEGWRDNLQVVSVSAGCLCIWVLQYRIADGDLQIRLRLGCHLIYYYVLLWISIVVANITMLFTVDLLNQSILQAKPLTPFLANFIGRPDLAQDVIELLSVLQRHELQWVYMVFIVLAGAMMFPFGMVLPYYNVWIMQRINQDLRLALVERWHQLSLRYHSDHRVGDSVYRIYQDSAQVTAIIQMLVDVLTQVTMYGIAVLLVAALDPLLGLLALVVAVIAVLWARWFSPRLRVRSLVAREANSDLTSRIQEAFAAVRVIKGHGTEDIELERFEEDSVVAFNTAYKVRSMVAIVMIVMFTLTAAILIGGEYMMAIWAHRDRETFAAVLIGLVGLSFVKWNLAAFQWTYSKFLEGSDQVRGLLRAWTGAQDMAMGLDRVFNILDIEPDVKNDPEAIPMPTFKHEIRFDNVSFAYETGRPVLKNISFAATPGSITAIVGPTGSGKSTLVGLLTRIFDPDAGGILIDGNDLRRLDLDSLRSSVSIALQENVLFAMSVRDNIRYVVPAAEDEQVYAAAKVACVDDYIDSLPQGLDTLLGDRGGKLSTGQRQRLSIARAIVKDAPILILDEPTAALDARTEHRVLERLAEWGEGRAIFLITHRISTIQRANHILYIDRGEIIESGSHAELMELDAGRYRRFVETESNLSKRSLHLVGGHDA